MLIIYTIFFVIFIAALCLAGILAPLFKSHESLNPPPGNAAPGTAITPGLGDKGDDEHPHIDIAA